MPHLHLLIGMRLISEILKLFFKSF